MSAAAVVIIIKRSYSAESVGAGQIQVLIDPEASDAEVLRAALEQVERDQE